MPKLTLTLGLPASGKSTWANQQADNNTVVVCKDDLRAMLWPDGKWTGKREKVTTAAQQSVAAAALQNGKNVIVADTNLNPRVQQHWRQYARDNGHQYGVKSFLDVPLRVCIERDLKRHDSVGESVIRRMYAQYVQPAPVERDPLLPNAYVFDVDGTLAHNAKGDDGKPRRGFFEWDRVGVDEVHDHVATIAKALSDSGNAIIVLTGRDGAARDQTEQWLNANGIPFDQLWSRAEGDQRKDYVVKRELYERHIEGQYNVLAVVDDRDQVIDGCWADIGLPVLQVRNPKQWNGF